MKLVTELVSTISRNRFAEVARILRFTSDMYGLREIDSLFSLE